MSQIVIQWEILTKRTDDPKLTWLEKRLDDQSIPHRRNGHSFHAPILEVPIEHQEAAMAILLPVDEIADDDPRFTLDDQGEAFPHDLPDEEDDYVYDGEVIGYYKECEIQFFGAIGDYSFRWQRWIDGVNDPFTSEIYGCKSKEDAVTNAIRWIDWLHYNGVHPDQLEMPDVQGES